MAYNAVKIFYTVLCWGKKLYNQRFGKKNSDLNQIIHTHPHPSPPKSQMFGALWKDIWVQNFRKEVWRW